MAGTAVVGEIAANMEHQMRAMNIDGHHMCALVRRRLVLC